MSIVVVSIHSVAYFFFFQAEDGIRDYKVTGVQTCALPIFGPLSGTPPGRGAGPADFRPGHWSLDCRCCPGGISIANPASRRVSLSLGHTVARRNRAPGRAEDDSRRARRGGFPDQCADDKQPGL